MINYHPSVCHQTDSAHVHYQLVLLHPEKFASDLDALRILAGRVGGQTAGQVIERVQELINIGFNLRMHGIDYMRTESIPLFQVCHKGEKLSPSIDWDAWLFVPIVPPTQNAPQSIPTRVAKINH